MGNSPLIKTTIFHAAKNGDLKELTDHVNQVKREERTEVLNDNFPDNITPLHKACENGFPEIVSYLVANGSAVDALDAFFHTPLYYAASENRIDVVKFLVQHKAKLQIHFRRKGAMGEVEEVEKESPLHRACEKGHIEVVRILIGAGADVNLSINDGALLFAETPLHRAAMEGHTNVVTFLVKNGAKVGTTDIDGNSALHKASYLNR